jgi:hypothetical protein
VVGVFDGEGADFEGGADSGEDVVEEVFVPALNQCEV